MSCTATAGLGPWAQHLTFVCASVPGSVPPTGTSFSGPLEREGTVTPVTRNTLVLRWVVRTNGCPYPNPLLSCPDTWPGPVSASSRWGWKGESFLTPRAYGFFLESIAAQADSTHAHLPKGGHGGIITTQKLFLGLDQNEGKSERYLVLFSLTDCILRGL